MKKILFIVAILSLLLPAHLFAQYSDASLNGTWIVQANGLSFMSTNGNGTIIVVGTSDDSIQPIGSYSVSSSGAISATLNFVGGAQNVTGQMINDSSANMYDSSSHGGAMYLYSVINPGALQGTWQGVVYDSSDQVSRNIHLTIDNMGMVTSATGVPLVSGYVFAGRDTFAGYITTTDSDCAFTTLQLGGVYSGDSLIGIANLGPHSSNCNTSGYVLLVKLPTAIDDIRSGLDFAVYPNPFAGELELASDQSSGNMNVTISDLAGRLVFATALSDCQKNKFDLSGLSNGMYLLTLTDAVGKTSTKKIIKN